MCLDDQTITNQAHVIDCRLLNIIGWYLKEKYLKKEMLWSVRATEIIQSWLFWPWNFTFLKISCLWYISIKHHFWKNSGPRNWSFLKIFGSIYISQTSSKKISFWRQKWRFLCPEIVKIRKIFGSRNLQKGLENLYAPLLGIILS